MLLHCHADMRYPSRVDEKLLEWEKVNGIEYAQKDHIAKRHEMDNRIGVIEDK